MFKPPEVMVIACFLIGWGRVGQWFDGTKLNRVMQLECDANACFLQRCLLFLQRCYSDALFLQEPKEQRSLQIHRKILKKLVVRDVSCCDEVSDVGGAA